MSLFSFGFQISLCGLSVVTHTFEYQLLGKWRLGGSQFKANPGKKLVRLHLNNQTEGGGYFSCLLSQLLEGVGRRYIDEKTQAFISGLLQEGLKA
jgi:hypothetical protein